MIRSSLSDIVKLLITNIIVPAIAKADMSSTLINSARHKLLQQSALLHRLKQYYKLLRTAITCTQQRDLSWALAPFGIAAALSIKLTSSN